MRSKSHNKINKKSYNSKDSVLSDLRISCEHQARVESSLKAVIAACDEAIFANDAGFEMSWFEANIIVAVEHALQTAGLEELLSLLHH